MTIAIEALKNLEPTQYQLAANIRDMLSSLENAKRALNPWSYYQPVFDLLLMGDYRLNIENASQLTQREWICFFLVVLHDYDVDVVAWVMQVNTSTVRTYLQRIREKLSCKTLAKGWVYLVKSEVVTTLSRLQNRSIKNQIDQ